MSKTTWVRWSLVWVLCACRGDDPVVTGEPFVCSCAFDPGLELEDAFFTVCTPTFSLAIDRASACAEENGLPLPWSCDCEKDVVAFCELGRCDPLPD